MVAIYVRMICSGKMTLEDVPVLWREQVREAMNHDEE